MTHQAFTSFTLPCGQTIKNRITKAAMEENMATSGQLPGDELFRLYERWANGGTGLLITGNVMVSARALTGPGGIVLEKDSELAPFKTWAQTAKQNNTRVWMQINHPGRQVYAAMGGDVLSPSDIALDMGKHSKLFGQPRAMTAQDIQALVQSFADTALQAETAGFDGVQIHAAHGYLISQFLSPLTNKRDDQYGGTIENRMRVLIEVIEAVRAVVSNEFAVSVKMNSADFQRGGFDADDAKAVVEALNRLPVDLLELSGGSYESPAMQGRTADGRTLEREAYFLQFAKAIADVATLPVMTTGGIRRLKVAEQVLDQGFDMVGIATALAMEPALPDMWQQQPQASADEVRVNWKDKTLSALAVMAITRRQLQRMGAGKQPKPSVSPLFSLIRDQMRLKKLTKRYQQFLQNQA
ncbi:NADH:flavin oxidoreductase/NADH oxidase family protein [Bacterioplanoides sp.]|uniref:NADH:flavin oxidoreductase/NADH oxidase family protein n=1 Tax=Bacterioplanoides sp. TaxID=2066072 RepID=UPI003B00E8F9